jgi:multiple antibiotic resistance protein
VSEFFNAPMFIAATITLVVIMDPPGTIPVFLSLVGRKSVSARARAARQGVLVSLGVITLFAVAGEAILAYLGIGIPALQGAGGLLLLLIALDLLTGKGSTEPEVVEDVNVALVPLGMPLLAGPGAIVSVILAVQNADGVASQVSVWTAIAAMHVVLWLTMRYSLLIIRVIKDGGVVLVTRLAGMMLSAIAVQQIINGVTQVIQNA